MPSTLAEVAQVLAEANEQDASAVRTVPDRSDGLRPLSTVDPTLRQRVARMHRAEVHESVAKADEATELWNRVTEELRSLQWAEQRTLLEKLLAVIESGRRYVARVRDAGSAFGQPDGRVEGAEDLDRTSARFDKMRSEVLKAIECRTTEWRPKDPERFERGLREASEGKTLSPDEVKAWLRSRNK